MNDNHLDETNCVKYRKPEIVDRQIDTLIGLAKGLAADGVVNTQEAQVLEAWLAQSHHVADNPLTANLLTKVKAMLEDGVMDDEESRELVELLNKLSGGHGEMGEIAKATTLPLDDPAPNVVFDGRLFVCTGTFAYGPRREVHALLTDRGATVGMRITMQTDYLIIGDYATDSWKHEAWGRKIERAVSIREKRKRLAIVSERNALR